jgi:hypothetical protein
MFQMVGLRGARYGLHTPTAPNVPRRAIIYSISGLEKKTETRATFPTQPFSTERYMFGTHRALNI